MKVVVLALAASSFFGAGIVAPTPTPTQPEEATISFKEKVTPILKKYCYNCHGGDTAQKGLKVDTYDNLMKGTKFGKVVKPGKGAESVIIKSVKGQPGGSKMPPGRRNMPTADIKTLTDWIDQGAKNN